MENTDKQLFLNIKNFSITDYRDDKRFLQLEIWGCCEGINRNESSFTIDSMKDAMQTLFNTPILCYIDKKKNDAKGHEMKLVGVDEKGNPIYNFDDGERIVGIVNESSNVRIEEADDGKQWAVYNALIFVDYNYELRQILQRDKIKSVSIEIEVLDSEMIGEIEQINKFIYKGTTILGKEIHPGIAGAMLKLLSFNQENFGQFKRQVAFALNNESQIKHPLPSSIKDIIKQQMDAIRNSPMNTTEQISTLITAKDLLANEDISLEQGEIILNQINDYEADLEDVNKQVLVMLLGGDPMKEFVKSIGGQDKTFVSKDNYGTGDAIKISLTKDSAVNESWGSVNKTKLRNDLLVASNYKSLIEKTYLVVDTGWEDIPSKSLHYPVCQINNNVLVYNVHGVQSARSFLEKNKDAPYYNSANTKLNKIYKKLGLDYDKNHIKYNEKEVYLVINKFKELFAQDNKYKFVGFDDKTVCVYSIEKNDFEVFPYSTDSEDHITMDSEKAKETKISMVYKYVDEDADVEGEMMMPEMMPEMMSKMMPEMMTKMAEEKNALMAEKDAEVEKSKQLAEEKEEFVKEKAKADEEKQLAEAEKEKMMSEKADVEAKFSALKTENEKVVAEVNGFKEQKFAEIIKYCSEKYKMSEEDIVNWTEKSKSFAQVEDFEKELVFTFYKANFKEDTHLKMGNLLNNKNTTKGKSAIQRLKEKQK